MWGDYNGDAYPDLAMCWEENGLYRGIVYRNQSGASFVDSGLDISGMRRWPGQIMILTATLIYWELPAIYTYSGMTGERSLIRV